jgi:hypothetical protein
MAKKDEEQTMLVKAIRKGFYNRVRSAGEKFTYQGTACPSWCVRLDAKEEVTSKSKDLKVSEVITYLRTLTTAADVKEFCAGDDRKGVLDAAEENLERIAKLTE